MERGWLRREGRGPRARGPQGSWKSFIFVCLFVCKERDHVLNVLGVEAVGRCDVHEKARGGLQSQGALASCRVRRDGGWVRTQVRLWIWRLKVGVFRTWWLPFPNHKAGRSPAEGWGKHGAGLKRVLSV